ncbi:hypothetical protein AVEN_50207-1, partial [Araneus ventricosus]
MCVVVVGNVWWSGNVCRGCGQCVVEWKCVSWLWAMCGGVEMCVVVVG